MNVLHYVITADAGGGTHYFSIDPTSGGYPYWSRYQSSARNFSSVDEAKESMRGSMWTKASVMSDGTVFPPYMIQSAAGLNYEKPNGSVVFRIVPVMLGEAAFEMEVFGKITRGQ